MPSKTILLILLMMSTYHFSRGQFATGDDIRHRKYKVEVSVLFNYNSTISTGSPLSLYNFYDYRNYWEYSQYYPIFHELQNAKANYELRPQFGLNLNLFAPTYTNLHIGLGIEYTQNKFKSLSTEILSSAKAELFFEGEESRFLFKPLLAYRKHNFYMYVNLIAGYGFSRNFNTYLRVTDLDSNTVTGEYKPDQEYFHDKNLSFGYGFSLAYVFDSRISLGVAYNNYWIGISRSFDFLVLQSHGFWKNSFSISVGYDLIDRS
ncbi:MAG: outer membrane beta-barrel protein [Bacteroidales bacterium]